MVLSAANALGLGLLLAAPGLALQDEEPPRLGVELAAKGPGCAVTFEELDALLLVRHGRSPAGRDALDSLVQLRVVEALGEAEGVAVTTAELNARWRAFEDQVVQGGHADSLEAYLAENQIQRSTFRRPPTFTGPPSSCPCSLAYLSSVSRDTFSQAAASSVVIHGEDSRPSASSARSSRTSHASASTSSRSWRTAPVGIAGSDMGSP